MRRSGVSLLLFSFAAISLIGASRPAQASDMSYARIVRLSLVAGDVQVTRPVRSAWEPGAPNMPITQGMTIGTNDGRAEVQFEDGSTAWISENTMVQFTELALSDGGRITKLTLAQGTVSIYADLKRADTFVISTSAEQVVVPKRSLFRVDAFHDGASISVMQGELQVSALTGSAGATTLVKGQTLAYKSKMETAAITVNPKADEWDRWVNGREQNLQVETAQSLSYANAPFSYGMGDLSAYGGWNYFAGYGYGWQPFGMTAGWAPFSIGQWASYPGLGWTWISFEPWGWVPYHFGDWMFSPVYGWMWFPNNLGFWDPAPVNWYGVGNQVAWSPRTGTGPRMPTTPRILIVSGSKSIGNMSSVRIVTAGGGNRPVQALSGGPLENGRVPRFGEVVSATNHGTPMQSPRAVVPTAPSLAHLQRSLATSASMPAMKMNSRLPAAPAPQMLRVENAMRMSPATLPHRPAPMYVPREPAQIGMAPSVGMGTRSGSYSAPSFSAPRTSSPAAGGAAPAPASHAVAAGRPH
ncbi:MAG: FecR family protein [Candidatus Acidiferrales bacterium]